MGVSAGTQQGLGGGREGGREVRRPGSDGGK